MWPQQSYEGIDVAKTNNRAHSRVKRRVAAGLSQASKPGGLPAKPGGARQRGADCDLSVDQGLDWSVFDWCDQLDPEDEQEAQPEPGDFWIEPPELEE